ncbi:MAG: acyl carrier protein [Gammaproteobacteria bacterium]|nr:acyl carrier protein [Gammaproteobacteria bacterium]NND54700.1 acyl carrier protein [Gammaproteobacteria bacterium]
MTRDEFLKALEEAIMVDPGTLEPGKPLTDIEEWDSLAVVELQGIADESLQIDLQPEQVGACETVDDLVALVDHKLAD